MTSQITRTSYKLSTAQSFDFFVFSFLTYLFLTFPMIMCVIFFISLLPTFSRYFLFICFFNNLCFYYIFSLLIDKTNKNRTLSSGENRSLSPLLSVKCFARHPHIQILWIFAVIMEPLHCPRHVFYLPSRCPIYRKFYRIRHAVNL
jgi:hypothetical protein